MKIYARNKDTNKISKYDDFEEFVCDNLTDNDIMFWLDDIYASEYPLPRFVEASISEVIKAFVSESTWDEIYRDIVNCEIDSIEDELNWTDENEDGTKTISRWNHELTVDFSDE